MRAASKEISRDVGFDAELSDKHSNLNQELTILGLTTTGMHRAMRKITSKPKTIDTFFSIAAIEKK